MFFSRPRRPTNVSTWSAGGIASRRRSAAAAAGSTERYLSPSTPVGSVRSGAVTPQPCSARSIFVEGAITRSHWSQKSRDSRAAQWRVRRDSQT